MLSEGIGEILTPLSSPPACHLVVVKPDINVSTAFVYGNLKADSLPFHPDIDGMAKALSQGKFKGHYRQNGKCAGDSHGESASHHCGHKRTDAESGGGKRIDERQRSYGVWHL